MVKIKAGRWWKRCLFGKHDWEYMFFEQPRRESYRYIKQCRRCEAKELFATKDMEDIPWE